MVLLEDVQEGLMPPSDCDKVVTCSGYSYYHYSCDGLDDRVSGSRLLALASSHAMAGRVADGPFRVVAGRVADDPSHVVTK